MAIESPPPIFNFTAHPNFLAQGDEEFNEQCQLWVDEQPPFCSSVVEMGGWMKSAADYVDNAAAGADLSAQDAADFADAAAAASNFRGRWSDLSGAISKPASVYHEREGVGKLWILLENLSNVATEEPGESSAWADLSEQGGIRLVSGPTDMSPERALAPGWMGYGATILISSSDDVLSLGGPAGQINQLLYWNADSVPAGLPFFGAGYAIRFSGSSVYERLMVFERDSEDIYTAVRVESVWGDWKKIGDGAGGGGGGTAAMQGFVDLGEMGAAGAAHATLDLSAGRYFFVNLNGANATGGFSFALTNIPASGAVDCVLLVARPGRKSTWTLPSNAKWANNVVPTFVANNNSLAAIHIFKTPNWTNFRVAVNSVELAP